MNTKSIIIIFTVAGLLGALIWLMTERSWEPLITSIGLVCALIAELYNGKDGGDNKPNIKMRQKGGKNSNNYQSSGDININTK